MIDRRWTSISTFDSVAGSEGVEFPHVNTPIPAGQHTEASQIVSMQFPQILVRDSEDSALNRSKELALGDATEEGYRRSLLASVMFQPSRYSTSCPPVSKSIRDRDSHSTCSSDLAVEWISSRLPRAF